MTTDPPAHARDRLPGSFGLGQRFVVVRDVPGDRYLVEDGLGQAVAWLPRYGAGLVVTRVGEWRTGVERQRLGWSVVLRTTTGAEVAAASSPSWLPSRYKLWTAPDGRYRLQQNPFSGHWTLRRGVLRLARFTHTQFGATSDSFTARADRAQAASIETFPGAIPGLEVPVLIVLALETIRADRSIPIPDVPS